MKIDHTLSPSSQEIDFLTRKINEDARKLGATEDAYPFGFFIKNADGEIVAGCNGVVVFGVIYTDQLWVQEDLRGQGHGKALMEQVHDFGRKVGCRTATVNTMSFQNARGFYEHLGYVCDFDRSGYAQDARCFFLKKRL